MRLATWLTAFVCMISGAALADDERGVLGTRVLSIDGQILRIGGASASQTSVVVFLDPACPIASRYAPELNEHFDQARRAGLDFHAVISDPLVTPREARAFRDQAELRYPIIHDATGGLAKALMPTVVPEAFVIDVDDRVVYRGRIDDRFVAIGRVRQHVTSHDLRDAIAAAATGKSITPSRTTPIGCVFEAWKDELPTAVTYTRHVQPILEANCVTCHRPGGAGPFSLDTFELAKRRARMIGVVTEDRRMPPWPADPHIQRFRDQRTLTERDIALLSAWAANGMPRGDEADALPRTHHPQGWSLGEPDAVVMMEEPYELPATGPDQYRRFVIPSPFKNATTIVAFDFQPGDPQVVHHVNIFHDTTGQARRRDLADAGPGYDAFGNQDGIDNATAWEIDGTPVGGWAPGSPGYQLPDGIGMYLEAGGDIVVEIHYHLSGKATSDQSRIAFYTAKSPVQRYADGFVMGSFDVDIPAGESDYVRHIYMDVPADMQLIDLFPHMHFLGTEMWAEATTPTGEKIPLIRIRDWDFRWQAVYQFPNPVHIPRGSRIDAWFRYDNSAGNPDNPASPPVDVSWGWQSGDEMLEIWATTVYTNASDSAALNAAAFASFYRGADPDEGSD